MKKFRCLAKDELGRQAAGTFEAADEAQARQKLEEQGYTIIHLREISEEKFKKSQGMAKFESGDPSKRKLGLLKTFLGALGVLVAIPAVVLLIFPFKNADPPDSVARQYLLKGLDWDFKAQYLNLSERYQKESGSPDIYARTMSNRETSFRGEADKVPSGGQIGYVKIKENKRGRAEVHANLVRKNTAFRFIIKLVKELGLWKVNYVRDVTVANSYLDFIAKNPDHTKSAKYRKTLIDDFFYSDGEIEGFLELQKEMAREEDALDAVVEKAMNMLRTLKDKGMLTEEEFEAKVHEVKAQAQG